MSRSSEALASLIEERLQPGADLRDIDRRIQTMFGEKWAVVFTDMAGFSRRAARQGIIPFLVLIHQMDKLCAPITRKFGGLVIKKIADSHMILFRDPREALKACVEMQLAVQRYNDQAAEPDQLYLGCGLGYGDVLKLGDTDAYGVEVNFAAKLGEDLAGPYEIFVTPDAARAIGRNKLARFRKVAGGRLGGTRLPYYEAMYSFPAGPPEEHRERAKRSRVRFR